MCIIIYIWQSWFVSAVIFASGVLLNKVTQQGTPAEVSSRGKNNGAYMETSILTLYTIRSPCQKYDKHQITYLQVILIGCFAGLSIITLGRMFRLHKYPPVSLQNFNTRWELYIFLCLVSLANSYEHFKSYVTIACMGKNFRSRF